MQLRMPPGLTTLLDQLRLIDESALNKGTSRHFLQIERSPDGLEVRIIGNPEGLIHFARSVLDVVATGAEGSHHHFDSVGIADKCDIPIVVSLKAAEWDIPR